jgi:glyoxylase-like metal-dependent hydrolase (beta-lactamase superfamily II)
MKKIAEDVYQISIIQRQGINCYIIEGILVDAGIKSSFNKIYKCLREVPVHLHVLTHAHADHQGATSKICKQLNIPLYCHQEEVFRTESGLATKDYPSSNGIIAKLQQKFWAGEGHPVSKTIKESDMIGNFHTIDTPGHSSGHVSFFREKDGVLIIGDVATNMNLFTTISGLHMPPGIFTSNKDENINSLRKLATLHPKLICFGHGPVLNNENKTFEKFVAKL